MLGLLRIEADLAAIEIGYECTVAERCVALGDALDLVVQAPPLLDDDDARRPGSGRRLDEKSRAILAVGAFEGDMLAHGNDPPSCSTSISPPFSKTRSDAR